MSQKTRKFNYKDEKSDKFWYITLNGKSYKTEYGKTGSKAREDVNEFESEEEALKDYERLIKSKLKKGYTEIIEEASSLSSVSNSGSYYDRIKKMYKKLEENPNIKLLESDITEPLPAEKVDELVALHLPNAPEDFVQFYKEVGSFSFKWESNGGLDRFTYVMNFATGSKSKVWEDTFMGKPYGGFKLYDLETVLQVNGKDHLIFEKLKEDKRALALPLGESYTRNNEARLTDETDFDDAMETSHLTITLNDTKDSIKGYAEVKVDFPFDLFFFNNNVDHTLSRVLDYGFKSFGFLLDRFSWFNNFEIVKVDFSYDKDDLKYLKFRSYIQMMFYLEQLFPKEDFELIKLDDHDKIKDFFQKEVDKISKAAAKEEKFLSIKTTNFKSSLPENVAEDYVASITSMVDELKEHPNIQVHVFKTFNGASDEDLDVLSKKLGDLIVHHEPEIEKREPSDEIIEFYKQTNGLQLIWELVPDGEKNLFDKHVKNKVQEDGSIRWGNPYFDSSHLGVIMIMPTNEVENWSDAIYEEGGKEYDLKVIDQYSTWNDIAILLDKEKGVDTFVLGEDQGANYQEANPFKGGFKKYFEFVLATRGAQVLRSSLFYKEGKKYFEEIPDLAEILKKMVKEGR